MKRLHNKGFTIIELLIATATFSLVLLILTGAIVQFNKIYYKGNIDAKTQEAARAVVEDIARNLEFSTDNTTPSINPSIPSGPSQGTGYFCIGGAHRYSYRLTRVLTPANAKGTIGTVGPPNINHALVVDNISGAGCPVPPNIDTGILVPGSRELLGYNMQLVNIAISSPVANTYRITAEVAYGDDYDRVNHKCSFSIRFGGQFCAFSTQTVTVTRRLN